MAPQASKDFHVFLQWNERFCPVRLLIIRTFPDPKWCVARMCTRPNTLRHFLLPALFTFSHLKDSVYIHNMNDECNLLNLARLWAKTKVWRFLIRKMRFADDATLIVRRWTCGCWDWVFIFWFMICERMDLTMTQTVCCYRFIQFYTSHIHFHLPAFSSSLLNCKIWYKHNQTHREK